MPYKEAQKYPTVGHPIHVPTDKSMAMVVTLARNGISQDSIAQSLGISTSTLRKYYADELNEGLQQVLNTCAGVVIEAATAGDVDAAKWVLSRRGREWSDKQQITHAITTASEIDATDPAEAARQYAAIMGQTDSE